MYGKTLDAARVRAFGAERRKLTTVGLEKKYFDGVTFLRAV